MWIEIRDKATTFVTQACVCYLPPGNSTRNVDSFDFFDNLLTEIYSTSINNALLAILVVISIVGVDQ